jgi:hypothetical protein
MIRVEKQTDFITERRTIKTLFILFYFILFELILECIGFVYRPIPGHETDHSPPNGAEVKKNGSIHPLHQYVFMA